MNSEILEKITQVQDGIIQMLFQKAPSSWLEIVVDFEIIKNEGVSDWLVFAVCKDGTDYVKNSLLLEFEDEDLFHDLWELYGQLNDNWSTVDVRLFSDGEFSFDFSYDPPYRLSNGLLEDSRFKDYHIGYVEKKQ